MLFSLEFLSFGIRICFEFRISNFEFSAHFEHKVIYKVLKMKMPFNYSTTRISNQQGFTFIEIVISSMIMLLLVTAVIHYHSSAGASKDQVYYLKAVQRASAELEKLRALCELEFDSVSPIAEFANRAPPAGNLYLFKFVSGSVITVLSSFNTYTDEYAYTFGPPKPEGFLKEISSPTTIDKYNQDYETTYKGIQADGDDVDKKRVTYFANYTTNTGPLDISIVVIDDMGSPIEPEDDLLGIIGWWVEDASISGPGAKAKKITFVLQFWHPGQSLTIDPEVIVLKTTMVEPQN